MVGDRNFRDRKKKRHRDRNSAHIGIHTHWYTHGISPPHIGIHMVLAPHSSRTRLPLFCFFDPFSPYVAPRFPHMSEMNSSCFSTPISSPNSKQDFTPFPHMSHPVSPICQKLILLALVFLFFVLPLFPHMSLPVSPTCQR